MMLHHASMWTNGNASQLRKSADDIEMIDNAVVERYIQKSNGKLTQETLTPILDAETWIPAKQCIEYGLADKIFQSNNGGLEVYHQMKTSALKMMVEELPPLIMPVDKTPPVQTMAEMLQMKFKNKKEV